MAKAIVHGDIKVVMNSAGARAILNGDDVQAILKGIADRAAASANAGLTQPSEGFQSYVQRGANRARAVAHTTDYVSRRHNAKTNALLKGLG